MANSHFSRSYCNVKEKNFSDYVDDKINKILTYAENEISIKSILALGSLAKRSMRSYSNLNVIFWIEPVKNNIFFEIKNLFQDLLLFSLQKQNKYFYYLNFDSQVDRKTFSIEIILLNDQSALNSLYLGSNFTSVDSHNIILLDKENFIQEKLQKALWFNESFKNDIKSSIRAFTYNFVEYFVKACQNYKKTDLYRYFHYMSRSYTELVRLESIYQNNTEDLLVPAFALERMDILKDFPFYKKTTPTISLSHSWIRHEFIKKFIFLLTALKNRYSLTLDEKELESFLNRIVKESHFWNLRDISYLDPLHIRPGLFYRSATLSRYSEQKEFQDFLEENKIHTIIDLRSLEEIPIMPYKNIGRVSYINIPIGNKRLGEKLKYSTPNTPEAFYEIFLRFYQTEIKQIFDAIASHPTSLVLHCYAGKDRTGIIVALLLDLLGEHSDISKELIQEDYLNSGNATNELNFNVFKQTIDEFGGSINYLKLIGLKESDFKKIFEKFLLG